jgi:hypothetical protein
LSGQRIVGCAVVVAAAVVRSRTHKSPATKALIIA